MSMSSSPDLSSLVCIITYRIALQLTSLDASWITTTFCTATVIMTKSRGNDEAGESRKASMERVEAHIRISTVMAFRVFSDFTIRDV
ncbi:hypothetical protein AgCh_000271 [Apium graveolens]